MPLVSAGGMRDFFWCARYSVHRPRSGWVVGLFRLPMALTSSSYLVFLIAVYALYWAAAGNRRLALGVVLAADYFFYAAWSLVYLALIPVAATIDYGIGRRLAAESRPAVRRALVALSVAMNVGLIASARYVPLLAGLFGASPRGWAGWSLPLSLSFYGFQAMTYTIDVFRRDAPASDDYLSYLAAVSFFPTTLAGPITRPADLAPQWKRPLTLEAGEGSRALFLIGLGFVKKFLIADYLGEQLVNRVFDLPKLYSGSEVLLGVYGYTFQLYYDFSGYTDIALGSALLLGMRLPINFNRPYEAGSIADFWRRWHISLSNWLRDYLFFSLPGKRGRLMPYLNLVVTFAIGGLWHGARWKFGFWGLLHGAGLALTRLWQAGRGRRRPSPNRFARIAAIVLTFHFVALTWVFFRAASLEAAGQVLSQVMSGTVGWGNVSRGFVFILAVAAGAHFWPRSWYGRCQAVFSEAPFYAQAAALVLLALAIQYIAGTGAAPFVYQRF